MKTRTLLAILLVGCAPHERPAPEPEPTPRAALARQLGLELADCAGRDAPAGGRTVWIAVDGVHVVEPDASHRRVVALAQGVPVDPPRHHLLDGLYEALASEDSDQPGFGADVLADRRVPMPTLIDVLYTLGRAGATAYHLGCGTVDRTAWVELPPPRFSGIEPDPPVIRKIRSDLALAWDETGLRAWALPRPAEHGPFPMREEVFLDSEKSPPRPLPDRVPLVLAAGADPPLTNEDVARLTAALCRFNEGAPVGVGLEPHASTPIPELLATAVAATAPCGGPRILEYVVDMPPRTAPSTVDGLKTLAQ